MLTLGPLPVSLGVALLVLAGLVALWAGHVAGRARQIGIGNVLGDMMIAALLAARAAFVVTWFDAYRAAPWSVFDIRDGGFNPWVGLAAALLVALWQGRGREALRRPLAVGLAAGGLSWGAMFAALSLMNNAGLPQLPLTTLRGEPADLAAMAAGKPMVINLWASWCPPCRHEMPVLAAAQQRESDVLFVFIDQGEDAATARRFLGERSLDLANVLLDSSARFGHEVGSGALPTTLFYDGSGRLVDSRVGELSEGSLQEKLSRFATAAHAAR
jgi:thiol-disulfide isomerase/thioredoxin